MAFNIRNRNFVKLLDFTPAEIKYLLKHLDSWAKPEKRRLPLTSLPGKVRVVPEPLGVAFVISPWNYPIQLLINPMAAAIAVLDPEIAPNITADRMVA